MAFLLIDLYNQYIRPYIHQSNVSDETSSINIFNTNSKPDIENNLYAILFHSEMDKSGTSDDTALGL
jgi:hypothetical protein